MFYLMDQPTEMEFQDLARRYGEMDPLSVKAAVTLLRAGSDLLTGFEKMLGGYGLSQGRFLILVQPGPCILPPLPGCTKTGRCATNMPHLDSTLERPGMRSNAEALEREVREAKFRNILFHASHDI